MRESPDYDWNGVKTRLTTHLPDDLVAYIQRAAQERGQTLSVWIQRAAEQALKAQAPEFSGRRGKGP